MNQLVKSSIGAASGDKMSWKVRQCLSLIVGCWLLVADGVWAQTPTPAMPPASPELEARLKKLETELRCLVCQNQTLADSPAGLAGDLRREIRLLADSGKNNDEIKAHLRARYGDFVLYKPEVEQKTWLLWFGPFALLLAGGVVLLIMNKRRKSIAPAVDLTEEEARRAKQLLGE